MVWVLPPQLHALPDWSSLVPSSSMASPLNHMKLHCPGVHEQMHSLSPAFNSSWTLDFWYWMDITGIAPLEDRNSLIPALLPQLPSAGHQGYCGQPFVTCNWSHFLFLTLSFPSLKNNNRGTASEISIQRWSTPSSHTANDCHGSSMKHLALARHLISRFLLTWLWSIVCCLWKWGW